MFLNKVFNVSNQTLQISKNQLGAQIYSSYSVIVAGTPAIVKYKVRGATNFVDLGELTTQHKLEVGDIVEFELTSTGNTEVIIQGFA